MLFWKYISEQSDITKKTSVKILLNVVTVAFSIDIVVESGR